MLSRRSQSVIELGPVAISTTAAAAAEHTHTERERKRQKKRARGKGEEKTIGTIITKSLATEITEQSKRNPKIRKSANQKAQNP